MTAIGPLHVSALALAAMTGYRVIRLVSKGDERPLEVLVWSGVSLGLVLMVVIDASFPAPWVAALVDVGLHLGVDTPITVLTVFVVGLVLFSVYTYTLVHAYQRRLVETHQELALLRQEIADLKEGDARRSTESRGESPDDD